MVGYSWCNEMINLANGYARTNTLILKKKKLKTPMLFLGQPIGGTPNPWEYFDLDGILLNAYHILQKPSIYRKIIEEKTLTNYLHAKQKTTIMLDSGGFLFQKKKELDIDCRKILELYHKIKPDIGVILDHPFSPLVKENENIKLRWKSTLFNTKIMLSEKKDILIIPVIHGFSTDQLEKNWNNLKKILQETNTFQDERLIIGIGSLVPLIMTSQGTVNGKNRIVDLVLKLRKLVPDAHIHAFGIGGTTTALTMFYLGVDSLDSVSWRLKAAKGAIQLPGTSDRFISPPTGRQGLKKSDEILLEECDCPICINKTLSERRYLLGPDAHSNFENRAIHNAWVYQKEVEHCRIEISSNNFEEFIHKRLKNSLMKSMFRYAVSIIKNKKLEI